MAIRYDSSLRIRSIEETLAFARPIAREVGIVRVTDTTALDRIGVPVFAAIRPAAEDRSLCVSAGKGLTRDEARVGAYMEGIELAFAEASRANVRVFAAPVADVLDGAILDLAPDPDAALAPDTILDCCEATDLATGNAAIVPAEKVIYPYVKFAHAQRPYFSSDGNGIASGNSLDEATLHGLIEVIERDVTSFHNLSDRSQLVSDHVPPRLAALVIELDRLGFDLWIRNLPNPYGMPTVKAILRERGDVLWGVHFGWGSHVEPAIAATRAVTEAVQHRLSMIHGGRDDIHKSIEARARISPVERRKWLDRHVAAATDTSHGAIRFDEVAGIEVSADLSTMIDLVRAKLAAAGLARVLRVQLGPRDRPLVFVRIIVPGAELYGHGITNIGPRLRRFAAQLSPSAIRFAPELESAK